MDARKLQILFCCLLVLFVFAAGMVIYDIAQTKQMQKPVVVTQETIKDTRALAKAGKVSPNTAADIQRKIETATPYVSFNVQAPTVERAATKVERAIKANSQELPKAATDKSDRTVITANSDEQKVDIYKINLNKTHKLKVGATTLDNKTYSTVAYEHGKFEAMAHFKGLDVKHVKGATVLYTVWER